MLSWVVRVLIVLGFFGPFDVQQTAAGEPPNIVFVVLDDMRGTDWQALTQTRALGGTWYPNFFLTTSQCCPSRTSILTGQYAHNHGVLRNDGPKSGWPEFVKQGLADDTIAYALDQTGYETALLGKFLNGYGGKAVPPGWDHWFAMAAPAYHGAHFTNGGKPRATKGYSTDVLANEAAQVISMTPAETPLFLYLAPKAPHGPAEPAKRHKGHFSDAQVLRDAAFDEEDLSDKPRYVRRDARLGAIAEANLDDLERRRLRTLVAVDEMILGVWSTLVATGRADNTYLFVLSDNGFLLGQHRQIGKRSPYDSSVRVPLLVVGPGLSGTDERLVANIDLAPTVADVAGIPFAADGRSLFSTHARDSILLEWAGSPKSDQGTADGVVPGYQALRTRDVLYVEYETGEREYYDYRSDPLELENLLADWGEHVPTADEAAVIALSARLAELASCQQAGCG